MLDDGYMSSNYKWTEWRERFAFFPKKIVTIQYSRWIWFRRYWERYRFDTYTFNKYGNLEVEMDYALNIFEILKKS
jgi:hypothetical protein